MTWRAGGLIALVMATLCAAPAWSEEGKTEGGKTEGKTEDVEKAQKRTDEVVSGIQSVLSRLQRTQITGYVQARALDTDNLEPKTNLFVRRARLNVRNAWDTGALALSFDGGANTVTIKDAYIDWAITRARGQRQGLTLRGGQFFRPFGYELERPESVREFLERPIAWDILFPGNRDQGFDLSLGLTPALVVNAAVLNGGGTSTPNLSFRDADDHKDVLVRVRYSLFSPRADVALSLYE